MRVEPDRWFSYLPTHLMWTAGVAAAYFLAGLGGLELAVVRSQVSPIWPASGIALFFLLHLGLRAAPGIAIGAFLVNLSLGPSVPVVAAIALGNTLAPVTAYLLLKRVGFRADLNRLKDALALIVLGGLAGMLVSATMGAGALVLSGALSEADFWGTWSVWWAGDAMGVLIVAPVLLVLRAGRPRWLASPLRWAELVAVLACSVAITMLVISNPIQSLFPTFLPVIWAAMRFQQAGAAPCALIISLITTLEATGSSGPFSGLDLVTTMIILTAFNGSLALIALVLSAVTNQRNQALATIEQTCQVLADAVTKLSDDRTLGDRTLAAVRRATSGAPPPAGTEDQSAV